jgi:peptidoglycan endopeptidase LytE
MSLIPWADSIVELPAEHGGNNLLSFQSGRARLLLGVLALSLAVSPVIADATYTVKSGDSLEKIAHRLSVSQTELIRLNHIVDSDSLALGQKLRLPTAPKAVSHGKATKSSAVSAKRIKPPTTSRSQNLRELARQRAALLAKGKLVVTQAQNMLGTPYVWGGVGSRGVDCSGLVLRSMREALGKDVPHHAADLFKMGTPVSYAELQPGDLVFFETTGNGVSHVGIWLGKNTFIHASCKHGVEQQKLIGYYAKHLLGARRLH